MALSRIDELNTYEYIYTDAEINKMLAEYFDVMDISEKQKEKRIQIAKEFRNALLFLFALVSTAYEYEYFSMEYVLGQFRLEYAKVLLDYGKMTVYTEQYFEKITKSIVETTMDHFAPDKKDFWTSDDRAVLIAEDEANSVMNYAELQEAIDKGKIWKKWKAEIDAVTRDEHRKINEKRIPIEEYFQFSDCEMLMPHDELNGTAKQCSNCRCALEFS